MGNGRKGRKVPLSEQQRLERHSLHATAEQKRLLAPADYYAWCVEESAVRGLSCNAQRSKVWLDILLHEEREDQEANPHGESEPGVLASSFSSPVSAAAPGSGCNRTIPYWAPPVESTDLGGRDAASPLSPSPMRQHPSPRNCHEHVIDCDIARSLWHVRDDALRDQRRRALKTVLMRCLLHAPQLHYYQGLHELAGAVLSMVGEHLPTELQVQLIDLLMRRRWHIFCHASLK
jgi:hypothetical protein